MASTKCAVCGQAAESGYLSTSNGSGLFWAHDAPAARPRPNGLEVLVGTGFGGTFSANLAGSRCPHCGSIVLSGPKPK